MCHPLSSLNETELTYAFSNKGMALTTWHHFEVNPDTRAISISEEWLRKGTRIFDGHYELAGTHLQLRGKLADHGQE